MTDFLSNSSKFDNKTFGNNFKCATQYIAFYFTHLFPDLRKTGKRVQRRICFLYTQKCFFLFDYFWNFIQYGNINNDQT